MILFLILIFIWILFVILISDPDYFLILILISLLIKILQFILIQFLSKDSSVKVELSPVRPLFRVGERQQLTCRMSKCSEKMTFSWSSLEDKPLYAETQTSLNESTLVFKSINNNHKQRIKCIATCQGVPKQAAVTVRVYCEFIY